MPSTSKKITLKAQRQIDYARDIRKFEIELTWKRSAYMSTFQGFLMAILGLLLSNENLDTADIQAAVLYLCVAGTFLSGAWILINLGSKFWQEYWEQYLRDRGDTSDYNSRTPDFQQQLNNRQRFSIARTNIAVSIFFFGSWIIAANFLAVQKLIQQCEAANSACAGYVVIYLLIVFIIAFAFYLCCRALRGGNRLNPENVV